MTNTNININELFAQLAQYNNIATETAAIIDGIKDQIKNYMSENNLDTLTGLEHKATYKAVMSNRLDTTALKKELPDIAARYSVTTETMRFNFS